MKTKYPASSSSGGSRPSRRAATSASAARMIANKATAKAKKLKKVRKYHRPAAPAIELDVGVCDYCNEIFPDKKLLLLHNCTKKILLNESSEKPTSSADTPTNSLAECKPCVVCQEKFYNLEDLKCHLAKHAGRMVYTCNVCNQTFKTIVKWKEHIQQSINASHCDKCGQNFGCLTANLRHKCIKLAYVCFECGIKFKERWVLDRHLQMHKFKNICGICNKRFLRFDFYKKHKRTCKGPPKNGSNLVKTPSNKALCSTNDESSLNESQMEIDTELSFNQESIFDKDCDTVDSNSSLNTTETEKLPNTSFQKKSVASNIKEIPDSTVTSALSSEVVSIPNGAQKSPTEEKSFNQTKPTKLSKEVAANALQHVLVDDESKNSSSKNDIKNKQGYPCNLCDRTFINTKALGVHNTRSHKKKRIHPQNVDLEKPPIILNEPKKLPITLTRETDIQYRNSERIIKRRKIQFRCDKCSKIFRNAKLLESHERVHKILIQKLTCGKCGNQFLNKAQLQTHYQIHSAKTREYRCEICNYLALSAMDIRLHRASHFGCVFSPALSAKQRLSYTCNHCNKVFPFKRFEGHYRKHEFATVSSDNKEEKTLHEPKGSFLGETDESHQDTNTGSESNKNTNTINEEPVQDHQMIVDSELHETSENHGHDVLSIPGKKVLDDELENNTEKATDSVNDNSFREDISGRVSEIVKHVNEPVEDACLPEEAKEKREDKKEITNIKCIPVKKNEEKSNVTKPIIKNNDIFNCGICSKILFGLPKHFQETCSNILKEDSKDDNSSSIIPNGNIHKNVLKHVYHLGINVLFKKYEYVYCCPECKELHNSFASVVNHTCSASGSSIVKEKLNAFKTQDVHVNCKNENLPNAKVNCKNDTGLGVVDSPANTSTKKTSDCNENFENDLQNFIAFLFENLVLDQKSENGAKENSLIEMSFEESRPLTEKSSSLIDKENSCVTVLHELENENFNPSLENYKNDNQKFVISEPNNSSLQKNSLKTKFPYTIKRKRRITSLIKQKFSEIKKLICVQKVSVENPHICKLCGRKFVHPQGIPNHYTIKHKNQVMSDMKSITKSLVGDACNEMKSGDTLVAGKDEESKENKLKELRKQNSEVCLASPNVDRSPSENQLEEMSNVSPPTEANALEELRENFSKLLCHLIGDKEVLTDFGWPKRLIDDVLVDVIRGCDHSPATVSQGTTLAKLRDNITILLRICVKEQAMENFGWNMKPVEEVVKEMLCGGEILDF